MRKYLTDLGKYKEEKGLLMTAVEAARKYAQRLEVNRIILSEPPAQCLHMV